MSVHDDTVDQTQPKQETDDALGQEMNSPAPARPVAARSCTTSCRRPGVTPTSSGGRTG